MAYRSYETEKDAEFSDLKGKVITEITGLEVGSERVEFKTADGKAYSMVYFDDCCASCSVDEIHGDVADLLNNPILLAEEVQNADGESKRHHYGDDTDEGYTDESFTWTFYKLSTIRGSVTVKWYGASNGYYSESASFVEVA